MFTIEINKKDASSLRWFSLLKHLGTLALAGACVLSLSAQEVEENDHLPTGKGIGTRYQHGHVSGIVGPDADFDARGNGVNYHGGPVMLGATNVYDIWYGNWAGNSAVNIAYGSGQHDWRLAILQHQDDRLVRPGRQRECRQVRLDVRSPI